MERPLELQTKNMHGACEIKCSKGYNYSVCEFEVVTGITYNIASIMITLTQIYIGWTTKELHLSYIHFTYYIGGSYNVCY